jgi:transcriptional regulator GlxA family with amidase domain
MDAFDFSRCFRREQGVTFHDYLMRMRSDNRSVLDITCSVGFSAPSDFARLFRRHMGVTPRVYRNGDEPAPPRLPPGGVPELAAG